jgi:hypothetical protein
MRRDGVRVKWRNGVRERWKDGDREEGNGEKEG